MLYDVSATTAELSAAHVEVAVVPIGAIEQHGAHLPLGTDWIGVGALARRVAEILAEDRDVLLIPALPFSLSQCHGAMPGTVWLGPETLADVLRDVVLSLREQGIRRVAVVNGHGGNFILDVEIRELNSSCADLIIINAVAGDPLGGMAPTGRAEGGDIHAGAEETSSQLFLNAEHVREQRVDYVPPVGREFLDYAFMGQISPGGVWGRPSDADPAKGREALHRTAASMARNILQAFRDIGTMRGAPHP